MKSKEKKNPKLPFLTYMKIKTNTSTFWYMVIPLGPRLVYTQWGIQRFFELQLLEIRQ
jgi:hypothetical protein